MQKVGAPGREESGHSCLFDGQLKEHCDCTHVSCVSTKQSKRRGGLQSHPKAVHSLRGRSGCRMQRGISLNQGVHVQLWGQTHDHFRSSKVEGGVPKLVSQGGVLTPAGNAPGRESSISQEESEVHRCRGGWDLEGGMWRQTQEGGGVGVGGSMSRVRGLSESNLCLGKWLWIFRGWSRGAEGAASAVTR